MTISAVKHRVFWIASSLSLVVSPLFAADDAEPENAADDGDYEELVVYGRASAQVGQAMSASEGLVGYDDISLPPMLRVGELVEAVPGLVATQHSGTGKANQYFIRGFNLDHGTDLSVSVEGVPVNMPTHGHGQGYLDLNFLIPETIETTRYQRGPYSASHGDFSSAASIDFSFYDRLPEDVVTLAAGEYGYYRTLAAGSTELGASLLTAAVDVTRYEGPWQLDEDLDQRKFLLSVTSGGDRLTSKFTLQGYDSEWTSTDQVPKRAVESGLIDALGFIDDDLGGQTRRYALTGALEFGDVSVHAYAIDYDFTLYSNFTYFLENDTDGDEFEQRDNRNIYGVDVQGVKDFDAFTLRYGGGIRFDDIDEVGLFNTRGRERLSATRQDTVEQRQFNVWSEAEHRIGDDVRLVGGLRADRVDWDVSALRTANSGSGDDTLLSPSAKLAWRLNDSAELYLGYGRGFHSNDVRGATIAVDPKTLDAVDPVDALVASTGSEIGLRLEDGSNSNLTLTVFHLELDSELVFVGDAGTTEPNGATERLGFEAAVFSQLTPWLAGNAAYTYTDARYKVDTGDGREIPGAVESTLSLGLNAAWDNGWRASVRGRWLSDAPLVEDGSVRSDDSLLLNAGVAYRRGAVEYRLDAFNLLDSDDDDIAYFYESRLAGEAAAVEDIHFHPLEPRSLRASVTLHWN